MWDGIRIESHFLNGLSSAAVISLVDRIREKKIGLPLWSVALDGDNNRWPYQNAVALLLRAHDRSFFDAETLAQIRRNDDRAALPHSRRLHSQTLRLPDY